LDKKILVTGADGFVGQATVRHLRAKGYKVISIVRSDAGADAIAVGDIAKFDGWRGVLGGVNAVLHLAGRTHVIRETATDPEAEFTRVNVTGTLKLAEAAAACQVKRFVFLSSIGVNGTSSECVAFSEADIANPTEPYALSKWKAECALLDVARRSSLQVTRVRPPVVIGPGAKGNLRRLLRIADARLPLPLGRVCNQRNFVGLQDLCELLELCVTREEAAGELFLAANRREISTPELLRSMAAGLGRRIWLPNVPLRWIAVFAAIVGQRDAVTKLNASLRVNSNHALQKLGWECRVDIQEDIRRMTHAYRLANASRTNDT
jgi:nucleoside-diphosphate-sugar epimerase